MDMTFENNQKSEERDQEKDKSKEKEKEQTNYDTYDNLLIENMSL